VEDQEHVGKDWGTQGMCKKKKRCTGKGRREPINNQLLEVGVDAKEGLLDSGGF